MRLGVDDAVPDKEHGPLVQVLGAQLELLQEGHQAFQ